MASDEYKTKGQKAIDMLTASGRALLVKTFENKGTWSMYVAVQFNTEEELDEAVKQGGKYTLSTVDMIAGEYKVLVPEVNNQFEKRSVTLNNGCDGEHSEKTVWRLETKYCEVNTCVDMKLVVIMSPGLLPFWNEGKGVHFRFRATPVKHIRHQHGSEIWTYPFDTAVQPFKRSKWTLQ